LSQNVFVKKNDLKLKLKTHVNIDEQIEKLSDITQKFDMLCEDGKIINFNVTEDCRELAFDLKNLGSNEVMS
jgi:hypothetical protein